jgi:quercetin dioxygenase-like cupin family protein
MSKKSMEQIDNRIRPYALRSGEGWTYRFGIDFTLKAREVREGSGAAVLEYVTRKGEEPLDHVKGEEPSDHVHPTEDEMFYVLEGAITFRCDNESFELEKGGFIFLPRGIRHGYTVRSEEPVRLLVVTSPVREGSRRGWGGFVADMELGQGELVAQPPGTR